MWPRFTEKARQIVYQSQQEAIGLDENYVSPEHLLLGLLDVEGNLGLRVLERLGIQPDEVRSEVKRQVVPSKANGGEKDIKLTPRAKKVIDLAYEEARRLKNKSISSEHLLLALIAEGENLAARVLISAGMTLDAARQAVVGIQAEPKPGEELLTMDEAVQFLNASKPTLYRVLGEDDLKGLKVGHQWRFRKADLIAYMERSPVAVAAAPAFDLDAALEMLAMHQYRLNQARDAAAPKSLGSEALRSEPTENEAETKTIQLAHNIVQLAIAMNASDIHLEPAHEEGISFIRLRYRVDGALQEMDHIPFSVQEALITRFKTMADMNINEKRVSQEGRIPVRHEGKDYDIRVSSVPSLFGESIVMRIVDYASLQIGLDKIGLADGDLNQIKALLHRPHGLFIATGPTGSGKTTLMHSCVKELARVGVKTISIEDPIDVRLPLVTQVQVNKRTGVSYASALRAFLSQDPDIIFVGELGDPETAQLATQASLNGHLVLTTLNTGSTVLALSRLFEMGLEPHLIAATVIGIAAQRLCRRICDDCKEFYEVPARQLIRFGLTPDDLDQTVTLVRGKGCEKRRQRGYRGRIVLFELLLMTDEIADLAASRAPQNEVAAAARAAGMKSLKQDGLVKVLEGITTPEEVLRVCAAN